MKILILGGHGFVGRNMVEISRKSPHKIIPLSRRDGLDLTNYKSTREHITDVAADVIINCAAEVGSLNYVTMKAADIFDVNMRMLLNLYKATKESVPDTVIINPVANCAFPGVAEKYTEDNLWNGPAHQSVFAYGNTRRMMIVLSETYSTQYGLRSINFFTPNMYGPYDSTDPNKAHALNALISKVVKAKHEGAKQLEVWGSGAAIREWLYAADCARIFLQTVERLDEYGWDEPINIGQNYGLSVRELINIIVKEAEYNGSIMWDRSMPEGAPKKVMDDRRFCKQFPNFKFTDLLTGIGETIQYYESIYPF